jgi:hypothetical protein
MEINDFKYFLFPTASANEDIFFFKRQVHFGI